MKIGIGGLGSRKQATPPPGLYEVKKPTAAPSGAFDARAAAKGAAVEAEHEVKVAVFVAHGMGQQLPFDTLNQLAEGLRAREGNKASAAKVAAIKEGEQWLRRIELKVRSKAQRDMEVHLYEGYWASLTEGKVTLRDVIRFLGGAGLNGLRNGTRDFYRWLFGEYHRFEYPSRIVLYLLVALFTVVSLVALNSTIVTVAAARALLADAPGWLSNRLFADLTTTFNVLVTTIAAFGVCVAVGAGLRALNANRSIRTAWSWFSGLLFVVTLFAIILAALSLAFLFYGHIKLEVDGMTKLWPLVFPATWIDTFDAAFDKWTLRLLGLAAFLFLLWWLFKVVGGFLKDLTDAKRWLFSLLITGFFALLVFAGVRLAIAFIDVYRNLPGEGPAKIVLSGLAWPIVIAASAYIRHVLIQFVGDVAVYVAPYRLDKYVALRDEIRTCVQRVASAIYALKRAGTNEPEYDHVIIVGHSLGSVIAYEVLNRLVSEDVAGSEAKNVAARTRLLLTFGSPLDKTAFIFRVQRPRSEIAPEVLNATIFPLIQDYANRPAQWINIYSPWDIISGDLEFFDPPDSTNSKRVSNEVDREATTFLVAHVEYWKNTLVSSRLHEAIRNL